MNDFHKIIVYIGTVVILVSFIYAFALRKKKELPGYFRFFYWIPFLALLASANSIIGIKYLSKSTSLIFFSLQGLLFLAEFSITCYIFYTIFSKKNKLAIIVFFIAMLFCGVLLFINGVDKVFFQLYTAPGLAIFILCMYYYYRLFDHDEKPILNLFKTPTFWIITGLFFYSALTFPLFAIYEYFVYKFGYKVGLYIVDAANVLVMVKHLFLIKAYRCAAKMEEAESKIIIDDV